MFEGQESSCDRHNLRHGPGQRWRPRGGGKPLERQARRPINLTGDRHPIHVHIVQFQNLARYGASCDIPESGATEADTTAEDRDMMRPTVVTSREAIAFMSVPGTNGTDPTR